MDSLTDAELLPRDGAAVRLAQRYAAELDDGDGDTVDRLGPKLLAVLTALGMSPAGRGVKGGNGGDGVRSRLDELRERRERRGAG